MRCAACGHEHKTMAAISIVNGGWESPTFYYCHEFDHSCYSRRNYERPA